MPPTSDPHEADYGKLDAGLASAMHEAAEAAKASGDGAGKAGQAGAAGAAGARSIPYLSVFVHLDHVPDPAELDALSEFGLPAASARRRIITANLSPEQVGQLSQQSLVRQLRLSERLDLQPDQWEQGPGGSLEGPG